MNILRAALVLIIAIVAGIMALTMFVETEERDLGPIPQYEMQDELDRLFEKGKTAGLTAQESERLQWLIEDRKSKINAYYDQNLRPKQ